MSKKRHNKTFGKLIFWVLFGITVTVTLVGLNSCTVTKQKHYQHTQSDTASSWDEHVQDIINSHELADTTIYTDADTSQGSADVTDTTTVIENDNQRIELTGIAGVKNKVKYKVIAKPKKVDFKVDKTVQQKTTTNKQGEIKASHDNVVVDKNKKTSYKWYVYASIALIVILILYWLYTKLKKYRNITKDTMGI